MAEKEKGIRVYFPIDTPEERAIGIKIIDNILKENGDMEPRDSGPKIRKKDKAKGPVLQEVSDPAVNGHEPLLGEASLGDEI